MELKLIEAEIKANTAEKAIENYIFNMKYNMFLANFLGMNQK
mgnify:CR=1 FL=1